MRRQCIIVIPLNNKADICQFWYTTALLRPVRVHQKVHKNSSPNWPKKAKIQRSLWSKELLQKLCYKTVLCLVGKIELKGTNLIGDVFSKDERRQNNSSKSIGRKLYSVLGIAWRLENKRYKTESDFQENGKHGPSERSSPLWGPWERPWIGGYQRFVPLSVVKFHDSLPVGEPVFSICCTCWCWVLNLHNISNIFPVSPSVEFLILQFSKLFLTSELILSTFTVVKQFLSSTFRA